MLERGWMMQHIVRTVTAAVQFKYFTRRQHHTKQLQPVACDNHPEKKVSERSETHTRSRFHYVLYRFQKNPTVIHLTRLQRPQSTEDQRCEGSELYLCWETKRWDSYWVIIITYILSLSLSHTNNDDVRELTFQPCRSDPYVYLQASEKNRGSSFES